MSDARDAVREKIRTRVKATLVDGTEVVGILNAFAPTDILFIAGKGGVETKVEFTSLKSLDDARFECAECHATTNTRYDGDRCADCFRVWAMKQPVPSETCEKCGGGSAFYSPAAKYFACAQCHAKRGTLTGIGAEARVLETRASDCKGADTEDRRHRWFLIKGHRYHCKNCPARRFDDPPAGTIWRDDSRR